MAPPPKPPKPVEEKPEPTGVLGEKLEAIAAASGLAMEELKVLSERNDPYLAWKHEREAQWFTEQFNRLVPDGVTKHLRGLHYLLVMSTTALTRPNGSPYLNDYKCWRWLQEAAKAARWLGYVPFDRIIDARNDALNSTYPGSATRCRRAA